MYHVILPNYTDFEEAAANLGGCCANDVGNYTDNFVNATGRPSTARLTMYRPHQSGYGGALKVVDEGIWFVRPGANLKPAYAAKDLGLYTQNNWKIRPNLTLNLGLRWDLQPGITERQNRMAGYDFTATNAFGTLGAMDFPERTATAATSGTRSGTTGSLWLDSTIRSGLTSSSTGIPDYLLAE